MNNFGFKSVSKLVGTSVGLGILGNKLNFGGVVPEQVSEQVSSAGLTTSKFISPAVNIHAGAYIINKLKKFGACCK